MIKIQSVSPRVEAMNAVLADNWWAVALRGLFAVLFGVAAFAMPGAALLALVLVFAAYSLVDGVLNIVLAARGARKGERWGLLLLNGLFGVVVGVLTAFLPGVTVVAFVFMIGAWALVSGGLMLGTALSVKISHGRWILVVGGVASLIYGVLLFAAPLIGALVLTWWLAAYSLVLGVILIALAFQLRKHRGEHEPGQLAASA
ncbi:HdeD family acid-resistance protein [Methylopila sp. 73B]|uniref:HdeD family acid-resistance protein n=1 Tax=Methylopila sp. 73B TaxID=1120792 RepID=UPI00037DB2DA|nr:HdeD family acid-resistance protein [Methylopila sp. 73B]